MALIQAITPCLWFDDQAEQASAFYTGIFRRSKVTRVTRYTETGREVHGGKPGSVMAVAFELEGQPFTALNGGPLFKFNEAVSFQVHCRTQDEVDYYWNKLSRGGDKNSRQCGWLKDKFGVSWQVVPTVLIEMLGGLPSERSRRVMAAMLKMKKLNIAQLKRAYQG
jgi:predicted 3-demethylubiquinone-9 3-methyltransferase (glyoxalase superfamily)